MQEFDFCKFMNNPISVFTILDGFWQSKGLDRFWRCQGMCWTPQNRLKTAGSMIATCLLATVFQFGNRVSEPIFLSSLDRYASYIYTGWIWHGFWKESINIQCKS